MEDADNLLPSKKRVARRELTQDTPLDDEEENAHEVEGGTFKRSSDEVLATRRIVKVRRQQTNSSPSSNPFAGIHLVTPTEATAEKQSADEYTATDDSKDPEEEKDKEQKQSKGETCEMQRMKTKNDYKSESEDKKNAADKDSFNKDDNDAKNTNSDDGDKQAKKVESEEPSSEVGNFKSFQQLSSNQSAFTGLAGTGSNTSLSCFGSMSKEEPALSSRTSSIIGLKNDNPLGAGLSNNANSCFGVSGASATISMSEGSGLALQEVATETGEENENVIFHANSVLFEFTDGSWKERGKGELKVNVQRGTENARLLMRARGNYPSSVAP
ncbi:nuclear pore complex protein NUP50A-like [Arachis duranensis]|uniref:Nuclear pore complex protein NUP50A-like n=1 Tax=Arachis duranensis TaxID=130453 RepID=A0A9C6T4R5_ARADU|nr:nuclear pore complex protein NUP50A-like [Arachis duranensis]